MLSFHQKRQLRNLYVSRTMQVILGVLCMVMAWNAYGRYSISHEMKERKERAEAELIELRARKEALEEQVTYITNERGIEAEMRRQFDIAREGEQVVIILDKETAAP